ncbi:adenine deaminase C-terminal domain-containing protein [Chloroflexota bacterium]
MRQSPSLNADKIKSLVNVAIGKEQADSVIVGGDLINVYTGEILKGWSVAIKGDRIAYVGEDAEHTIGPDTEVLDASGKTLVPGFIDGHAHVMHTHGTIEEFLKHVTKSGTTTIISETLDFAFALGYEGVIDFLESVKDQPIKIFATAPSTFANGQPDYKDVITPDEFRKLLEREEIMGVGESNWVPVIRGDEQVLNLFAETLFYGKTLEGHSSGARNSKLVAFVASGNSSDHEPIATEEVLERLRLGMCVMMREGDVRNDLEAIAAIKDEKIDFRRLSVTTDGIGAKHLIEHGYVDSIVQKAIDLGFNPITAIQMATLNVAEHFHIDNIVGGIAPGKCADIVVLPNVTTIKPEVVISNGQIVSKDGKLLVEPRTHSYPDRARNTVRIPRELSADDFAVRVDGSHKYITARVIDIGHDIANKLAELSLPVIDGELKVDVQNDILKVAAIDRIHNSGKMFVGLVKGFGLKKGAFAATAAWDVCNVVVIGASEEDMAVAVNRVRELQGGPVVFADGEIKAELPMPIAGQTSELPMEEIARHLEDIQNQVANLGSQVTYAHLMLNTLTTTIVPAVRISTGGLIDVKTGGILDFIVG